GYYSAVIGWVLYYTVGQIASAVHLRLDAAAILPPDAGFAPKSLLLQLACTGAVIFACAVVLQKGLRRGIETASKVIIPTLFVILLVLDVRALTLPGAGEGVRWYLLKLRFADLNANVMVAAMGHAVFSLSLGGTFMVVYGSYLGAKESLRTSALWTVAGDTVSGLLAGLAIIPAVFALGLEPTSGPGLIFSTLPGVFDAIPLGWLFGLLFFVGLFGAGYLSDVAAFEVLVAGLTDNTRLARGRAIWLMAAVVFLVSIPPTINTGIFVPWDLTFGSGMQTLGSLLAILTLGWCVNRSAALEELSKGSDRPVPLWLFYWIRFVIPAAILIVGAWWLLTSVFGAVRGV
ncbi:MAG: sodium-dependent transporter, partial [Anaerolineales bacterium]